VAREQTRRVLIASAAGFLAAPGGIRFVAWLAGVAAAAVLAASPRSLIRIYQLGASGHNAASSRFFTACWPRVCAAAQSHELIKRTAAAAATATAESGCAERAKSLACMSVSFQLSGPQNSTSVKQTLTMGL
jgi:hypothetical protein